MTSSPLRILFVSHTYVVGVNQGKLNAIAETGKAEVGLLAPSNWKALEWNRVFEVEKPYPNIQIYSAPVSFTGRGGAHFYAPGKIWQVMNDFQPDIVQVEEEVFSFCAFELAVWSKLTGKPLVVFGWENMERALPILRHWICQFVLNTAQLIIAGNHDGANILRQWNYTGLIEIMPQMGVDQSLFTPQQRAAECRNDEFHIGFLGRFVPEKGIDTLFAATRQLRERGLKCRIVLCGSGSGEEALKHEAQKQQVADSRNLAGSTVPHDKAPEELSKFDVLVLPSRTIPTWKEQFVMC
jgi:glycosyltransferase involved in cell wall biosynthesis